MSTATRSAARTPVRSLLASATLAVALVGGGSLAAPAAQASAPSAAASHASTVVSSRYYTRSTVAKHHTARNCWSIVDHRVYNLTKWVAKHPGGRKRIVRMCGKDASAAFHSQHSTGSRASRVVLRRYLIGRVR